MKAAWRVEKMC